MKKGLHFGPGGNGQNTSARATQPAAKELGDMAEKGHTCLGKHPLKGPTFSRKPRRGQA